MCALYTLFDKPHTHIDFDIDVRLMSVSLCALLAAEDTSHST